MPVRIYVVVVWICIERKTKDLFHQYARVKQIRTFAWNVNLLLGVYVESEIMGWETAIFKPNTILTFALDGTFSSTFRTNGKWKLFIRPWYYKCQIERKHKFIFLYLSSINNTCLALVFIGNDSAHVVVQDEIYRHLFLVRLNNIFMMYYARRRLCLGWWGRGKRCNYYTSWWVITREPTSEHVSQVSIWADNAIVLQATLGCHYTYEQEMSKWRLSVVLWNTNAC